jgi:spore coat polysaccharide biosynthesis protein SpsF
VKTLVVVQARMGSTRLPGKVLLPLAGRPLLERMLERVRAARVPFELCVATTEAPEDEPIASLCARLGVHCFRGHPTDLLDRHVRAARWLGADAVAKIPSDCPLIDPLAIEHVLREFQAGAGALDFVTNLYPPTWPDGNDVEVATLAALEAAHAEAERPFEREHTTPFIWERPERFRIRNVRWPTGLDYSHTHRLTIDYPADYALIAAVYAVLQRPERIFGLDEVLELLAQRPEILAHNTSLSGQSWHMRHAHELRSLVVEDNKVRWVAS